MGLLRLRDDRGDPVAIITFPGAREDVLRRAAQRYLEPGQFLLRDESTLEADALPGWDPTERWTGSPERAVAVFENPFRRAAVCWHQLTLDWKRKVRQDRRAGERRFHVRPDPFARWLKNQTIFLRSMQDPHPFHRAQSRYLLGEHDALCLSWEHEEHLWERISDHLCVDLEPPPESRYAPWNWRKPFWWDPSGIELVRRLQPSDFLLNWEWEVPTADPEKRKKALSGEWRKRIPTRKKRWNRT